jgi:hypothetical protein
MTSYIPDADDYRDDRMYVMRLTSDFSKSDDGRISASMNPEATPADDGLVLLITYRNTSSLPAVRVDDFASLGEAVDYVMRVEPTCPRISLNGKPPYPVPSWEDHLSWLHRQGLKSVAEGDFPQPHWLSSSGDRREVFVFKESDSDLSQRTQVKSE